MPTTPWYKSKSTWSHIIAFLIGVFGLAGAHIAPAFNLHLPSVPAWLLTLLSAAGLYENTTN